MSFMEKLFGNFSDKELKRIKPIANKVLELEPEMQKLTDEELQAKTPYLKEKLKNGASLDDILPEALAACRDGAGRGPGQLTYAEPRLIVSQLVYAFTHFFTGLEVRHDLGGNFDSISALRITAHARRTVIERKASKATDFNPAALR